MTVTAESLDHIHRAAAIIQQGGGSRVERVNAAVAELASEYPNAAALPLGLGREWLTIQSEWESFAGCRRYGIGLGRVTLDGDFRQPSEQQISRITLRIIALSNQAKRAGL